MVKRARNPSAYNMYQKERHQVLKVEHPDKNFQDLNKMIAAEWKEKSPEEKIKYKPPVQPKAATPSMEATPPAPPVAPTPAPVVAPAPAPSPPPAAPAPAPAPPNPVPVELPKPPEEPVVAKKKGKVELIVEKSLKKKTSLEKVRKRRKPPPPPSPSSSSSESEPSLDSDEESDNSGEYSEELVTSTSEVSEASDNEALEDVSVSDYSDDALEEDDEPPPVIVQPVRNRFF